VIEEREVISLFLALFAIAIAVRNRRSLATLPAFPLFVAAGLVLAFGLVVTILEGLAWGSFFNTIEHVSYGSSSLLLAIWAWAAYGRREPGSVPAREREGVARKDGA